MCEFTLNVHMDSRFDESRLLIWEVSLDELNRSTIELILFRKTFFWEFELTFATIGNLV